jgi:hypothetical protein
VNTYTSQTCPFSELLYDDLPVGGHLDGESASRERSTTSMASRILTWEMRTCGEIGRLAVDQVLDYDGYLHVLHALTVASNPWEAF